MSPTLLHAIPWAFVLGSLSGYGWYVLIENVPHSRLELWPLIRASAVCFVVTLVVFCRLI